VLTVTELSNAEYLISSVALSIDEYYAGVGESPGVWTGRWAEALGLSGVVEADHLRALVDGKHPILGVDLLAGNRPRLVLAFDLTFSCPKSVSLLWALGSEPVAEVVSAAHREAIEVAMGFLEERAALARVQSQGVRRRVATKGWVVAGFVHRTSREGDPQLHTHCLVPNLVQRTVDGRHVAIDAGPLFEWARAAGCVYQNHLQGTLAKELGVAWGPDRNNTREMEGFSRSQLRAFSKRSAQIEAELEATGATYESPALRMQADDAASLATRTAKDHTLTPSLLTERWLCEADQVGLASGPSLDRAVCQAALLPEPPGWEQLAAALVDPEIGLCSRSARFTRADVVEHLCALSGGRLSMAEIAAMADQFVDSDLAVRLTPDTEAGGRRPAEWSTASHRAMEDRTVALMDILAGRPAAVVNESAVEAALCAASDLGDDQVAAVRMLTGERASLRTVLSPAGYGKTTMLHSAARAAAAAGRPVMAVATTAKAVAELSGAGLDARTIARLRIDLTDGPLAAGTVVVLDEISQTPTCEVEAVLAAVDACPGGSIWVLGDPRQSQPVGAGGAADRIEQLAAAGVIASARLTVNRRQVAGADREALDLLRRGEATASQQLRAEHGWEHEHPSPTQTREAMAQAVWNDICAYGAEYVAALVVSHRDAEDLADRIRARLTEAGLLIGPTITGPGWTTEREYQAGDRVLLHARCGRGGSRLVNGTTATVTLVGPAGLTVRVDGGEGAMLPAAFVSGFRKDGAPNLSHSWARTVDGAQGGTWEACHLLGSSALDAYRGYTGQSRSRRPTHTWNTTQVAVVDHGGILAEHRDGAEQVADALSRQPDPSLAARNDPWVLDRQLRQLVLVGLSAHAGG
jgi:conjugative relaxase-like TrwC/TraI family protein